MADKIMCSERVYQSHMWNFAPCSRRGVVEGPDGRMWCRQHSPEAVKARGRASDARYEMEMAARRANTRAAGVEAVIVELESMVHSGVENLCTAIDTLRRRQKKGEL